VLSPDVSRLSKKFCPVFANWIELKPILRLNFSKITDVFRPVLRPLLKKLPSKRRFNLGVEDQMFDLFEKL
jgi:hypothetical protein